MLRRDDESFLVKDEVIDALLPRKMTHSKSGLPINGFAFFINQRLPLVVLIYKNISVLSNPEWVTLLK